MNEDPSGAFAWVDGVIKAQKVCYNILRPFHRGLDNPPLAFSKSTMINFFLQTVFQNPLVKDLIERTDKKKEKLFDAVFVCCALYGEEPGYYLAHRVVE